MSTTTEKLGLIKLELTDPADITLLNQNWDKIDESICNFVKLTKADDLYNIRTTGFYYWEQDLDYPLDIPTNFEGGHYLRVFGNGNQAIQEIFAIDGDTKNCVIRRTIRESTSYPWEYENPPLATGVEYRTTERYNKEAVYVTLGADGIIHKRTESGLDITPIRFGESDLTEGVSPLANGCLYFVYE